MSVSAVVGKQSGFCALVWCSALDSRNRSDWYDLTQREALKSLCGAQFSPGCHLFRMNFNLFLLILIHLVNTLFLDVVSFGLKICPDCLCLFARKIYNLLLHKEIG